LVLKKLFATQFLVKVGVVNMRVQPCNEEDLWLDWNVLFISDEQPSTIGAGSGDIEPDGGDKPGI